VPRGKKETPDLPCTFKINHRNGKLPICEGKRGACALPMAKSQWERFGPFSLAFVTEQYLRSQKGHPVFTRLVRTKNNNTYKGVIHG